MNKELLDKLEKQFGTSEKYKINNINSDILMPLLETKEIPRKILIEIYGGENTGKSTLLLHLIKEAQLNDYVICLIDTERSFDKTYANTIVPKLEELIIVQEKPNQNIIDTIIELLKYNVFDIIFIDSIATINSELLKENIGKLKTTLNNSDCLIIYTNQIRFFRKFYSRGGRTLKLSTAIRLKIQKLIKKDNIFTLECKLIKHVKPIKDNINTIITLK